MEQKNPNPIEAPDITGDINKLNQVVEQPDFAVSKTVEKQWGIPSTEDMLGSIRANTEKPKPKSDPFLDTIKAAGFDASTNAIYRKGRDLSKFKDYVANTGFTVNVPEDLLESERALNQSNWEQAGYAVGRVLGNIIPEIGQQVSRMFDWSNDYSKDSPAAQAFQDWKNAVNEVTPIYRERPDETFDFGDFAYWMDQGSNIATSAAAFAAIGYATGGIASGVLGEVGAMGARVLPNAMRTATGAKIANYVKNAGTTIATSQALTHAESVGVSIDTYNESYNKELEAEKAKQQQTGKTDEEIVLSAKTKASKAAAFAYNMNQVNFFLNLTSAFKFNALGTIGSRGLLATDSIANTALNTSRQTLKQGLLKEGAHLALEAGQEYAEETINYVAQRRGVEGAYNDSFSDIISKGLEDAKSSQGREAGFWGAIGGIAQSGFTAAGSYIPMYKNKAYEEAYSNERGKLAQEKIEGKNNYTREEIDEKAKVVAEREAGSANKRVSKHFIEHFREKKLADARNEVLEQFAMVPTMEDTSAEFTPESGKAIREATNMLDTLEEQGRMFDAYDQALSSNNIERAEEIRSKFTTRQIMEAIQNGTANTLERVYQSIANLTPDQAVEYGLSNDKSDMSYKESAKDAISKLRKMETQIIRNNRYVNSENVNDVDADIMTLTDSYKRILRNKLGNIIPTADDSRLLVDSQNLAGVTQNFTNDNDQGILDIAQIEEYQKQITQQQALYNESKNAYDIALSENERQQQEDAIKELDGIAKRIDTLKDYRTQLTSKETQQTLKRILAAIEESRMEMASNINDTQNDETERTTRQANQNGQNPSDTQPDSENQQSIPPTSPVQAPEINTPDASTDVAEEEGTTALPAQPAQMETTGEINEEITADNIPNGDIVEIVSEPDTPVNTVDAFNLDSNPFFSALVNKLGENNPFIKAYAKFISDQLTSLQQRQDNTDVYDLLNKIIYTFNDDIMTSVVQQEIFLQKFPAIRPEFQSNPDIITTINNFFATEAERFSAIRDSIENLSSALSDIADLDADPNIVVDEDSKAESFDEDAYSEENPFDIDQHVENQTPTPLNFRSTAQIVLNITNLLDTLNQNGIPVRSWEDFYIQLVNSSSKDVVNSVLPRLKNIWQFIVQDNVLSGTILSPNDYQIDESLEGLDTLAESHELDQGWGDNKANSIASQTADVINDIVQSTPTNVPILVQSGSGLKSNTIFKLAYAAREYVIRTMMKDGVRIDTKQDFDDSLNNNNDYELFDTANLVAGTELVLIPLNIGESYSYFNPRDGKKYTFTRRSVDKVSRIIDNGTAEILDAVDHMPIFISKSTNRKDIIDGTFLHLPDWANTDNMAGDNIEVKLQQQMLRDFREKVINNVNKKGGNKKLIRVKIQNKTAGIPITSRNNFAKTSERITENLPLALQLETGLQTRPGESAVVINNTSKLPLGTVFALLPTPVGQIAYPLQRTKLKGSDLKQSIMTVLDLFFTLNENLTDKQKKDIQVFKQLGLDVKSFSAVRTYLNNILYTGHLKNVDGGNKVAFEGLLNSTIEQFRGKSIFRLGVDSANKPYLQFGRIGTSGAEMSFETFAENKDEIMSLLEPVLDNAYPNASLEYVNKNKKILGVKEINGELSPAILYNNYNDMLKDTSVTSLSPKVITNPNTGKDKTIYTFQQTISFETPETVNVNQEGEVVPTQELPINGRTKNLPIEERDRLKQKMKEDIDALPNDLVYFVHQTAEDTAGIIFERGFSLQGPAIESTFLMMGKDTMKEVFSNLIDGKSYHQGSTGAFIYAIPRSFFGNQKVNANNAFDAIVDNVEGFDGINLPTQYNLGFFNNGILSTSINDNISENIIEEVEDTIQDEEDDFFDTDDDGLYSYDENPEESPVEYTFEEAIAPYTYIPGINNLIQNSVIFQAINNIYESITEQGLPKGIEASVNETLATISQFYNDKYDFVQKRIAANKFPSEEAKTKAINDLNAVREKIDLLVSNRDKIIDRAKLVMKQEGLAVRLTGKAKKKYLEKLAKQKEINEDEREAEDLGLEPIRDTGEKETLLDIGESLPNEEDEILDSSDENDEEMSYDKDAMTVSPTASLTQELKQFFNSVKQTVYDGEKFVQKKNFLGLYNTVPFNTVFQKVQELLAQYPTEPYKQPTIEKFIQVLKDNQRKSPYLTDIIERLENPNTTEDFKNAFVLGMYKMYNNTVFTNITYNQPEDEESAFYSAAVTSVTSNNVVSLLMNQWEEELEAQGILEESQEEDGRTVRIMNNEIRNNLQNLYFNLPSSKAPLQDFVKLYKSIGITLPTQMVMDLANGILKYNDSYHNILSFIKLPIVKYSIESVIGNPLSGDVGIVDANSESVYGNSSFISLAKLIGTYEDNLTTNSSRNLNGDMIFNMSEVKNLIESFFSVKDINKLLSQMKDPYHRVNITADKRFKTWREQLLTPNGDSYVLNNDSNFSRAFRYYTLSGTKVKDANGTTVMEIESMSENDHILDHLLLFINQAKSIGTGKNLQHLAIYPYLTMSDKKVPMAFSAPSVRFMLDIFSMKLQSIPEQTTAQQQIDYLYEVMLLPDIRRMEYLDNNPSINIKEYSKENAKFYTMPALNLIDFDYVDGDINKELDTTGELRTKLGLTPDQNLFDFKGIGSNTERVINMNVLKKPEVIVYLKQKMLALFNQNAQETFKQLLDANIVSVDNSDPNNLRYFFNDNNKVDTKTLKNLGFDPTSISGVEDFVYNYSVNKMLAYAQMQDLLIGDPIQYAKPSGDTKAIKRELKEINEQRAQLIINVDEGIVSEQEANNIKDELSRKENDARFRLIRATGQQDVLSANDNQGKRLASDNASGQKVVAPATDSHYNMLVMTDVNVGVADRDFYYKYLVPNSIKEMADGKEKTNLVNKILEKYLEIDQADAQEFTTLKEHLNNMVYLQEISREEADRILKDDNDGKLKADDYSTILQSMKMVYASNFERDNINSKLYVKSSSFPLSNTFVKGLPIEDLYKHMMSNNIHRATFKTAVKVGSPIVTAPVFNTDGTINKEALRNTESSVVRNIPRTGHKKQQNVPYKEDKHQLNDGTQKAKMIFVNLMDTPGFKLGDKTYNGRELHNEYVNTYREMYRLKAEELKNELYPNGLDAGIDYVKLHRLIIDEAESRGYSENDIAFLQLNNDDTNFLFPLWLSGNEKKLSSLLNSIVDNRIRKRKREGISGVLVSDIVAATNPEYKSNITYTTMDRANQLRSMRDENGKIIEAEVIVPFRFRDNQGRKLKMSDFIINEGQNQMIDPSRIPSEVLDIIGFRIPTQGLNSMIAIKIVGFLPEGYENVIIAPVDVVAQMGSDFDVDKMFQDYVNTTYEDGKLRRLNSIDVSTQEQTNEYKKILKALKQAKLYGDDVRIGILTKQLETIRKDYSQTEFLNIGKNLPKNLKMRMLEDKIFDIQKAILMNPHADVQAQRVQPIDSATFVNITKNIMPQVFDSKLADNWSPYTLGYQIKKYLNARGGKVGVSTWSSTSVLNAVLQGIDFKSNPMYLQSYDIESNSYVPIEYTFLGQKSNYINNPKGDRGHFKSDIIQALQSITVDNENLQIMHKLNLNEFTNDFIRAAILLGYDESSIFYFINHPVIKEIVKGKTNKTVIRKPKNTYNDGEKEVPYSQANMFTLIGNMKPQQLIDDIQNNAFDENDVNHYAIYAFFMEMSKHGKTFKSLESLLNVDSKGIGSNLFYSLEKESALLKLKDNTQISNVNKVLGDFAPTYAQTNAEGDITSKQYRTERSEYNQEMRAKGYVELQDAWFLPTTIPAMAAGFALVTNNRLWTKSFPYASNTISSVAGIGLALENNKANDQLYSLTDATKGGTLFINNEIQEDSIGTASPTKDSEIKQEIIEHLKSYLYSNARNKQTMSNQELVDSLSNMKELVTNNLFLKKLSVEKISREGDVNMIVFDAGSKESGVDNNLVNDIIELLTHKEDTVKDFMKNLILQQLAFGGIQKAKQFVKHIPPHYLKHLGVYDDINANLNELNTEAFITQYIQHNPHLVVSKELWGLYRRGEVKLTQETITLPDADLSNSVLHNPRLSFISMLQSNGKYMLFKRDSIHPDRFVSIPLLGKNAIREYSLNDVVAESQFDENNPKEGWYNSQIDSDQISPEEYSRVKNIINTKLTLGLNNPDSEEAIVKICK